MKKDKKDKIIKFMARLQASVLNPYAMISSTEIIVLLVMFVAVTFGIIAIIKNSMGNGESDGILKSAKNIFDSKQT